MSSVKQRRAVTHPAPEAVKTPGDALRAGRVRLGLKPLQVTMKTEIQPTYIYDLEANRQTMPEVFNAYVGFLADRLGDEWAAEMAQSVFMAMATGTAATKRGRDQLRLAERAHHGWAGGEAKAVKAKRRQTPAASASLTEMAADAPAEVATVGSRRRSSEARATVPATTGELGSTGVLLLGLMKRLGLSGGPRQTPGLTASAGA